MFGLPRINDRPRNVRLDTLVRLRWLAVLGQFGAVLVVHFGLEFEVPIWACLAVIALSALLNVALRVGFRETQWLEPDRAAWLLGFDIAELAALLYLTGGLENPFAEEWRRRFALVEAGSEVDATATIHDSVILRGGSAVAEISTGPSSRKANGFSRPPVR